MDIDVSVVIAYRDMGCPYRLSAFTHVLRWYHHVTAGWWLDAGGFGQGWDCEVIVETGRDDASFTRASAINAGIRRAAGAVIVQADPDNLVGASQLRDAIIMAREANGLVFPHDRYVRLNAEASQHLLTGQRGLKDMRAANDYEDHGPRAVGGVVVFSRSTWKAAGEFDERFGLWGGDDAAFAYAAAAFTTGHRRLPGDVTHLWHPKLPQSEIGSPGYIEQFAILAGYRDAAAVSDQAVRDLVWSR